MQCTSVHTQYYHARVAYKAHARRTDTMMSTTHFLPLEISQPSWVPG